MKFAKRGGMQHALNLGVFVFRTRIDIFRVLILVQDRLDPFVQPLFVYFPWQLQRMQGLSTEQYDAVWSNASHHESLLAG